MTSLQQFIDWLNSLRTNINFTEHISSTTIEFLDLRLDICEDKLHTTLFRKPVQRNSLLHFHSFHPGPLRKGLPFGQFLRLRRLCYITDEFKRQANALRQRLLNIGYPLADIQKAFKCASHIHRECLLDPQYTNVGSQHDTSITGVLPFTDRSSEILRILRNRWPILQLMDCFRKPLRIAFSRGCNLGDWLMKTSLEIDRIPLPIATTGHSPCNTCAYCAATLSGLEWHCQQTMKIYKWKWDTTCQSVYVVYFVHCPCSLHYIGRTIRSVKIRLSEHASRLRQRIDTAPMVAHCIAHNHVFEDLVWTVIDHVPLDPRGGDWIKKLQWLEQRWIFQLDTIDPKGLNHEIEWLSVL